ncbi:PAS domain S-box-containing protein/TyrR family helix-turn-helix domain-containing protein [Franzmannia pantelleriensis]|uniref:HTH-type transcriptional regulatory protein TyrR n=1 Tax=Franzmannia pantelleriensis TaxID=48727 RepID=A0A1G9EBM1_9GAMM|nr:sigma 54-interacting transcriptional regulator [Halomonas pantelleriensis]SDK73506.1 PAS domain S-box-containing protein/TyrR family helix-turn-helix domain-containing protein [Halomonas pantelleriensis]
MSEIDSQVLATIVETASDHFFIVDGDGRVLDVSPGAAAVYGMSREALCRTTVHALEAQGVLKPSVSLEVMRTGEPAQVMQQTATGRRVVAQAHPVHLDGELVRVVSRSMDLTDLQLLQDEYALLQQRFSDHLKRGGSLVDDLELDSLEVRSGVMREIAVLLKRVAPTDATVLLLGESGVGKTAFARQLHRWSQRGNGPFIDVNCASIPESLFESEMFGYQPGAFSGATRQGRAGLLEQADGGTLFLDEIGELPLAMQTKLLKVIQDGSLTRLGDTRPRRVDFRLVVATNQDLAGRVEEGSFRLDLYYRVNVIPVTLPPLRERREDIPVLAELQLARLNQRYGGNKLLHASLWSQLMTRDWPGNVRELENTLERAWLSSPGDLIEPDAGQERFAVGREPGILASDSSPDTPDAMPLPEGQTLKQALSAVEHDILASLCRHYSSTYAMARRLGISQPSVVRKLQKHGLTIHHER